MKRSELTEETLEIFIRNNKDAFNRYDPSIYHNDHFFFKLINRFKKFVSIVPYIWKVAIGVIVVWGIAAFIWWYFNLPTLWVIFQKWIN